MGAPSDLTLWRVDARVPTPATWPDARCDGLCELTVDFEPPASGPEIELSFTVGALSGFAAEMRTRADLSARGLSVLAIRSRLRGEGEVA